MELHLDHVRRGIAVLATSALGVACSIATALPAAAATASASYSPTTRVLTVVGTEDADDVTVTAGAGGTIGVSIGGTGLVAVRGGRASVANTDVIEVYGQGGNDRIVLSRSSRAVLPRAVLRGGAGDDTLVGSDGDDQLLGQTGNDTVDGGLGDDRLSWADGDGDDVVAGGGGHDTFDLVGSSANERVELGADGEGVRLTRDVGHTTTRLSGVEDLALRVLGGGDRVVVGDLTGTGVGAVRADLAGAAGTLPDGQGDNVEVRGSGGDDVVALSSSAGDHVVSGLSVPVRVLRADPSRRDNLIVDSAGGDDSVFVDGLSGAIGLVVSGGEGSDVIQGGPDDDVLFGGAGDDVLFGYGGDDVLDGGADDDILIGGTGDDVLLNGEVVFNDLVTDVDQRRAVQRRISTSSTQAVVMAAMKLNSSAGTSQ